LRKIEHWHVTILALLCGNRLTPEFDQFATKTSLVKNRGGGRRGGCGFLWHDGGQPEFAAHYVLVDQNDLAVLRDIGCPHLRLSAASHGERLHVLHDELVRLDEGSNGNSEFPGRAVGEQFIVERTLGVGVTNVDARQMLGA
jgi:hypothetical protein